MGQQPMEFRLNIMLSVVIHATLIAVAAGFVAVRGAGFRAPEKMVTVALLEDLAKSIPSPAPVEKTYAYNRARPELAKKEGVPAQPEQVEKPKKIKPPQSEAAKKRETRDGPTDRSEPGTDNAGVILQSQGSDKRSVLRGNNQGSPTEETPAGEGSPPGAGWSGAHNPDVIGAIRAAIEKAINYPPLAKRRGIEGTATTEFTINSRGYPENIRIVRSSGSDILDTAAKNTVLRASPFPFVKGGIEVPITFRLNGE